MVAAALGAARAERDAPREEEPDAGSAEAEVGPDVGPAVEAAAPDVELAAAAELPDAAVVVEARRAAAVEQVQPSVAEQVLLSAEARVRPAQSRMMKVRQTFQHAR